MRMQLSFGRLFNGALSLFLCLSLAAILPCYFNSDHRYKLLFCVLFSLYFFSRSFVGSHSLLCSVFHYSGHSLLFFVSALWAFWPRMHFTGIYVQFEFIFAILRHRYRISMVNICWESVLPQSFYVWACRVRALFIQYNQELPKKYRTMSRILTEWVCMKKRAIQDERPR